MKFGPHTILDIIIAEKDRRHQSNFTHEGFEIRWGEKYWKMFLKLMATHEWRLKKGQTSVVFMAVNQKLDKRLKTFKIV